MALAENNREDTLQIKFFTFLTLKDSNILMHDRQNKDESLNRAYANTKSDIVRRKPKAKLFIFEAIKTSVYLESTIFKKVY